MTTKAIYLIKPREDSGITAKPRLVRAARRASAENYLLGAFAIDKATPEECVTLGAQGAAIEDAGE